MVAMLLTVMPVLPACGDGGADPEPGAESQTVSTATSAAAPQLGDHQTRTADAMVMVYVPGGEFPMGSTQAEVDHAIAVCNEFVYDCLPEWFNDEMPVHTVSLQPFWIDRTEVANGQYAACIAAGACAPPFRDGSETRPAYFSDAAFAGYPVMSVSVDDAAAYCTWVGGRLPTEAEWEYAARGPQGLRYPWGNEFDGNRLNYCDANCVGPWSDQAYNDGFNDTAPVGSFPAGASWCGALDMAGNVWEWTADWKGPYPAEAASGPTGPPTGELKVIRGGAWDHERCDARSAYRTWYHPSGQYGEWDATPGFRCVSTTQPAG